VSEAAALRKKFSELIVWERVKRREKILLAALSYAFIGALLFLPGRRLLPAINPFYFPGLAFALFAAGHFWLRPWSDKDSVFAFAALDRALRLDERALTAAEIVQRGEATKAESYVVREAAKKLQAADVRTLFGREWSWHAFAAPALAALWLALLWLGVGADFGAGTTPRSVAEKVRQFSEELAQKAEAQKLAESVKIARALKAAADERLSGKTGDEKFGQNLTSIEKRLEALAPGGESDFDLGAYTREELAALKAELEAAQGRLRPSPSAGEKELLERLQSLPRAGEAMKRAGGAMENMGPGELRKLLERLEQESAGELERRSLADVQQFLSLLLKGDDSGDVPAEAQIRGRTAQQQTANQDRSGGKGELPGDQPGAKGGAARPPTARAGAATRVTGALGEGGGSGVTWRGEAKAGESKIPEQEAPASYRRQMEEELAAEKIPPALKETVKKYFLSLGSDEKNRR